MLIKSEYDLRFTVPFTTPTIAMLHLHPSLETRLTRADRLIVEHTPAGQEEAAQVPVDEYIDSFGNRCSRFVAEPGGLRLWGTSTVEIAEATDAQGTGLAQTPVEHLPAETLQFLLASRYCQVDQFVDIAQDLFGGTSPGWERAAAIRDWVHGKVRFDYQSARSTKTALDVFTERVGVCRDFQHLAVTMTRCMNIPARYVTGYLGDIRMPAGGPGDFSAWYQIWLDGRWWDIDARHNNPRYGRVLMAAGRDAADVAITTSFGVANLTYFRVDSNEVDAEGNAVPLPPKITEHPPAPVVTEQPGEITQASAAGPTS